MKILEWLPKNWWFCRCFSIFFAGPFSGCPVFFHEMRRSMVIPGFWTQKHRHWDLKQKGWRMDLPQDLLKMSMFFNYVFLYSCIPWHTWSTHTYTIFPTLKTWAFGQWNNLLFIPQYNIYIYIHMHLNMEWYPFIVEKSARFQRQSAWWIKVETHVAKTSCGLHRDLRWRHSNLAQSI